MSIISYESLDFESCLIFQFWWCEIESVGEILLKATWRPLRVPGGQTLMFPPTAAYNEKLKSPPVAIWLSVVASLLWWRIDR